MPPPRTRFAIGIFSGPLNDRASAPAPTLLKRLLGIPSRNPLCVFARKRVLCIANKDRELFVSARLQGLFSDQANLMSGQGVRRGQFGEPLRLHPTQQAGSSDDNNVRRP
ncbi:MAG: hypothetical protein JW395_0158 [Nitrospira sp.]|nr:hypothetical protein [Nitrospira sp.]